MILAPMCSLNDFGPGFTREAEPIMTHMKTMSAADCWFGSKCLASIDADFTERAFILPIHYLA